MFDAERKKASFRREDLSHLIYGGKAQHEAYLATQKLIANDPILRFDPTHLHQSRADMIKVFSQKFMRLHEYHDKYPLDGSSELMKTHFFLYSMPLSLHAMMFLTTLRNLCDQDQEKIFLQPALRGEIMGCYAQTELAHGSDVQSLMTTATYDPTTQTFIINTPEVGATKWWIGDLGLYCTHACLFAQLIINNKRHGVHCFLVPIRDPNTFKTFPGVEAGDIGPKLGFQNKDNGFAIFNNYRLPRKNMLMKYHIVSKNGEYLTRGNQKISYATMLLTRSGLTETSFFMLSKGATISVRYSLIRSQFKDKEGKEISILDYQTQQDKVFPRIAEAYATLYCFKMNQDLGKFVFEQSKQGRFDRLKQAHIITSATKAIISYDVLKGLQILRRAAGGHGFHLYNGLIGLLQEYSPVYTLEGEFTVLILQVARFLVKWLANLQKGKKLPESVSYLELLTKEHTPIVVNNLQVLSCPQNLLQILIHHSCQKVQAAGQKIMKGLGQGLSQKEIWNTYAGLALMDAGIAHSYVIVYQSFFDNVQKVAIPEVKAVLTKLLLLFGIDKINERSAKFFETQTLSPQAMNIVYQKKESLLQELRPQALTLVQAFDYDDNVLMSAIGSSDGKPYQNLIDWAKKFNTINRKEERDQVVAAIKAAKQELRPAL